MSCFHTRIVYRSRFNWAMKGERTRRAAVVPETPNDAFSDPIKAHKSHAEDESLPPFDLLVPMFTGPTEFVSLDHTRVLMSFYT